MRTTRNAKRSVALLVAAVALASLDGAPTGPEPEPPRPATAGEAGPGRERALQATLPEDGSRCRDFCVARDIPVYVPPNRGSLPMRIGGASRDAGRPGRAAAIAPS